MVDSTVNPSVLRTDNLRTCPPPALATQIGGSHYKTFKIQPVEYIHANNIPFLEGNAIKYISRWRTKGGVADLDKAIHCINLLKELEREQTNLSSNSVQSPRMGSQEAKVQGSIEEGGRANGEGYDSVLPDSPLTPNRYIFVHHSKAR